MLLCFFDTVFKIKQKTITQSGPFSMMYLFIFKMHCCPLDQRQTLMNSSYQRFYPLVSHLLSQSQPRVIILSSKLWLSPMISWWLLRKTLTFLNNHIFSMIKIYFMALINIAIKYLILDNQSYKENILNKTKNFT